MKLLKLLEKSRFFWSLVGLSTLFFVLRLPSIIEPYWYGDEGIYQVVGQAINNGQLLYRDIWDNKPPLLYLIYAFANGDQMTVRFISLIVGLFSVTSFYLLSQKLFSSERISFITTLLFVLLFATPFLEGNIANAENFIILPILLAALLITTQATKRNFSLLTSLPVRQAGHFSLPLAGFLLGIAFLFKIVAIFDLAAFSIFLFLYATPIFHFKYIKSTLLSLMPLFLGFLLPFLAITIYFASQNILIEFLQGVFSRNVDYVGFENTLFGIPQGLLLLKMLLLLVTLLFIVLKRKIFSTTSLFVTIWIVFALFNANFSGRPYIHYLLVLLPSFCLLVGLALQQQSLKKARKIVFAILAIIIMALLMFPTYGLGKTFVYYVTTIQFVASDIDVRSYQSFFDSKTPRDYAIASFLNTHAQPSDEVFIWGDSAQIYTLANKLPLYKYAVSYHVIESNELLQETQKAINEAQPKYIVVLPESQPLPFRVPLYIIRFNVEGAIIYERSF